MELLTVGHGTASADELAALLTGAGVALVVDVRRYPGSRRHPQFSRDAMAAWLPAAGVAYVWEQRLGGRRRPEPGSPDVGLRDPSFRAYAGWMRGPDFRVALAEVLAAAAAQPTAVLCSESLWWRCHRRLVADTVQLVQEVPVRHLGPDGRLSRHVPTAQARRAGDGLVYDAGTLFGTAPAGWRGER